MTHEIPNASVPIRFRYRNWKGEVAERFAIPRKVWFGTTEWHKEPGWLLTAFDMDKLDNRDFALADCVFDLSVVAAMAVPDNSELKQQAEEHIAYLRLAFRNQSRADTMQALLTAVTEAEAREANMRRDHAAINHLMGHILDEARLIENWVTRNNVSYVATTAQEWSARHIWPKPDQKEPTS